jgi:hypothetical protein
MVEEYFLLKYVSIFSINTWYICLFLQFFFSKMGAEEMPVMPPRPVPMII